MVYGEHQEIWAQEMASLNSSHDARWSKWIGRVETLLQINSLDGDQEQDGYSLDFAYRDFLRNVSPETYAIGVKRARS